MSKDIWGRLHNDRRSRDQEIDKIARFRSEVEKEESECLSRRTTARKHTTREPNPVILDRARTRRVERMTAISRESTPSFRPRILPKSADIVKSLGRLSLPASLRLSKPRDSRTYHPHDRNAKTSSTDPFTLRVMTTRFLARQEHCVSVAQTKRNIRDRIEYRNCSFRPTLNPNSEKLVAVRRATETQLGTTERLAVKEPVERMMRRKKMEEQLHPHAGVPEIDPHSAVLATTRRVLEPTQPVYERLYTARSISRTKLLGKENSTELCNSPIARPKSSNALYAHVKGRYDLSDPTNLVAQLEQSKREKEIRIQRSREEAARREIEECTFQPNCSKKPPRPRTPVSIKGMDKYLEAKRIARDLTNQRKTLDDSYVSLRSDGAATTGSASRLLTVPSPFKFNTQLITR